MKKLFLSTIFTLFYFFAFTQVPALQADHTPFNNQHFPSWSVQLPGDKSYARDNWEEFIENRFDVKVSGNGLIFKREFLIVEQGIFPSISEQPIDLHARITQDESGSFLEIFPLFEVNTQNNRITYPYAYQAIRTLVRDFYTYHHNSFYKEKVESVASELESLEKQQERLVDKRLDLQEALVENAEEQAELAEERIDLNREFEEAKAELQQLEADIQEQKSLKNQLEGNLISQGF